MRKLIELLDLADYVWGPESPRYIHIAGTNGKGSVTSFAKSILMAHGCRTGAAFSPYVDDFRERVQFGSEPIPHADFLPPMARLVEADEALLASSFDGASAFELKTALGFLLWKNKGADAVALEAGMGGRLDASNVVDPASCVIVSIGWDHREVLGSTLAQIAYEKAGIIKPQRPLILGRTPKEAEAVILHVARERGAPVWEFDKQIIVTDHDETFDLTLPVGCIKGIQTRLYGDIQRHNASLAIAAVAQSGICLDHDLVRQAVSSTLLPGRFEEVTWDGLPIVLDGAHNEPAAKNLAENLIKRFPKKRRGLLLSMLQGHDPLEFVLPLAGAFDLAVAVTGTSPRGRKAEELLPALKQIGLSGETAADRQTALNMLRDQGAEVICATGSFYGLTLVREAALGAVKS